MNFYLRRPGLIKGNHSRSITFDGCCLFPPLVAVTLAVRVPMNDLKFFPIQTRYRDVAGVLIRSSDDVVELCGSLWRSQGGSHFPYRLQPVVERLLTIKRNKFLLSCPTNTSREFGLRHVCLVTWKSRIF